MVLTVVIAPQLAHRRALALVCAQGGRSCFRRREYLKDLLGVRAADTVCFHIIRNLETMHD